MSLIAFYSFPKSIPFGTLYIVFPISILFFILECYHKQCIDCGAVYTILTNAKVYCIINSRKRLLIILMISPFKIKKRLQNASVFLCSFYPDDLSSSVNNFEFFPLAIHCNMTNINAISIDLTCMYKWDIIMEKECINMDRINIRTFSSV